MPFYERGDVRIYFEVVGSSFPLLLIPGGGLESSVGVWSSGDGLRAPVNAMEEFRGAPVIMSMSKISHMSAVHSVRSG